MRCPGLMMSVSLLRSMIDRFPFAVAVFDEDLAMVSANRALEQIAEVSADASDGRVPTQIFGEEAGRLVSLQIQEVLRGHAGPSRLRFRLPGGARDRVLSCRAFSILSASKTLVVTIIEDVTSATRWGHRALDAACLSSVAEFAAGVAHEINNPLTAVLGFSEMAMRHRDNPIRVAEYAGKIQEQAERIADIVQGLNLFVGEVPSEKSPCDLNALLSDLAREAQPRWTAEGIRCAQDLSPGGVWVLGSPSLLRSGLGHILTNARQAVLGREGDRTIWVQSSLDPSSNLARIEISDNGPGLPGEQLSQLFHPFFTTREVGQGKGLGLAMAYGIVATHGGRLHATNRREGPGAAFVMEIPGFAPTDRRAHPREGNGGSPRTVFIIEDELIMADALCDSFAREGWTVTVEHSRRKALKELGSAVLDILIVDLPRREGDLVSLCQSIVEAHPALAGRVIGLSRDPLGSPIRGCPGQDPFLVLQKPFHPSELLWLAEICRSRAKAMPEGEISE